LNLLAGYQDRRIGVGESSEAAAKGLGIPHPVGDDNWRRIVKRAGPPRYERMFALRGRLLIALHEFVFNSKGTKNYARQATEAGIPTYSSTRRRRFLSVST
jgi:hypothetical protein